MSAPLYIIQHLEKEAEECRKAALSAEKRGELETARALYEAAQQFKDAAFLLRKGGTA
jgi:hypothetical protein